MEIKTMKKMHKFNYNWKLSDGYPAPGIEKHGRKVFSCFACGGGSTMGYKLAGYDVIGCNEIDPKMNETYVVNHNPKHNYLEDIREFVKRDDLPLELYNLDILDGSPPCSSFSMSGNREKDWGQEKQFREGQSEQVLDTLFFDFISLAEKLQPKVVVAENVKGLIQGEAKEYVYKIVEEFNKAGYAVKWWLLDGSEMGVPQKRQRVFFVALRYDLCSNIDLPKTDMFNPLPILDLDFNEPVVTYGDLKIDNTDIHCAKSERLYPAQKKWVEHCPPGKDFSYIKHPDKTSKMFNSCKLSNDKPCTTITARFDAAFYFNEDNRHLNAHELCLCGSYPIDYNFGTNPYQYIIGMSVPPLMTAQLAHRIKEQWFDNIMFEKKEDVS